MYFTSTNQETNETLILASKSDGYPTWAYTAPVYPAWVYAQCQICRQTELENMLITWPENTVNQGMAKCGIALWSDDMDEWDRQMVLDQQRLGAEEWGQRLGWVDPNP